MAIISRAVDWFLSIHWTPEAVTAAATIALAFLTLVLAAGTFALWRATRRLVKDAKQTAERQLRAYVVVHKGRAILTWNDHQVSIFVDLRNSGQTPAYKFRSITWIDILDSHLPPPFERLNEPVEIVGNPNSIIGPKSPISINRHRFLEGDDLDRIQAEAKIIYVWGRVDYVDAFGIDRWFIYRWAMFGPEQDLSDANTGKPAGKGWGLRPHELGYEAN
jgi:hypothetical protein